MKPRLLDLFCGAGGAAMGYHRAGFEVIGVDIRPQPRYPFAFVQADALAPPFRLSDFDAIHASPPCQMYSAARVVNTEAQLARHWDSVPPTRELLATSGRPFVIENVPGSPLQLGRTVRVCGLGLGLKTKRHRYFESNVPMFGVPCVKGHPGEWYSIHGNGANRRYTEKRPRGAGRWGLKEPKREGDRWQRNEAMGVDWMSNYELSQAIPPAYTEFIGRQLLAQLERTA